MVRVSIGSALTEREHVEKLWQRMRAAAEQDVSSVRTSMQTQELATMVRHAALLARPALAQQAD